MSILDKAKDAASKAAEAAKSATAAGKDKYDDYKLAKQADDLAQQIGELVVQQRNGDAPADADAQIETKVGEINELRKQMESDAAAANDDGDAATA